VLCRPEPSDPSGHIYEALDMRRLEQHSKVFGIGLSKTAGMSLAEALNILGVKTAHCPCDPKTFEELRRGHYRLTILEEYQGATDTPIVPYYPQLDPIYPGSKFILTVREKESWLRSAEHHWSSIPTWWREGSYMRQFSDFISACVFGSIEFSRERFLYVYESHYRQVTEYFKDRPDDLLIMDICGGDSWEQLCSFLGMPIPDVPFPHANRAEYDEVVGLNTAP
jgi:hypothetical protein